MKHSILNLHTSWIYNPDDAILHPDPPGSLYQTEYGETQFGNPNQHVMSSQDFPIPKMVKMVRDMIIHLRERMIESVKDMIHIRYTVK